MVKPVLHGLDRDQRRAIQAAYVEIEAALAAAEAGGGGGVTLEQVQDDLGNTSLIAGVSLSKTYDDVAGTITLDVDASDFASAGHTHAGSGLTEAQVRVRSFVKC